MAAPSKNVPTLTAKAKQTTLAAKKKKKKTVRNLVAPPTKHYWPVINYEDDYRLSTLLKVVLPDVKKPLRTPKENSGGSKHLRNKKEKKKKERKNVAKTQESKVKDPEVIKKKEIRDFICIGVNAVSRSVENNKVSGVLLASDTNPVFLNQHLAALCALHGVPVLAAPSLRATTRNYLGFSCIALGVKNVVAESSENHFHNLYLLIQELSKSYEPPAFIQSFRNSLTKMAIQQEAVADECSVDTSVPSISTSQQPVKKFKPEDLYLYRTSKKMRVFNPNTNHNTPIQSESSEIRQVDFLACGNSESPKLHETRDVGISQKYSYVPLNYKRVKFNPNKRKR